MNMRPSLQRSVGDFESSGCGLCNWLMRVGCGRMVFAERFSLNTTLRQGDSTMRKWLVVVLLMGGRGAAINAADVTLVQQRQAVAVIVLAADAPWIERHAANELSQFVMRITGASLPIVEDGAAAAGEYATRILIGSPQTHAQIGWLVKEGAVQLDREAMGADGFAIKTVVQEEGQYLLLSGCRGRSHMYAVYDFLEKECGVGYFWNGDQVPQQATLRVPAPQRTERPFFTRRMAPNACSYVYTCQYWGVY